MTDPRRQARRTPPLSRLRGWWTWCLVVVGLVASGSATADQLATYLERLRLDRLLAEHLERALAGGVLGEERTRVVDRLAEVYPDLLEREQDAARRAELSRRSQAFLDRENPKQGDVLRLSLLRARYRSASRIAEDDRAALADDASAAAAATQLEEIGREASVLRGKLEQRAKDLDRRTDRTGGFEGEMALGRADRVRGLAQEAASIEAWSLYYRSVLTGDRHLAEDAQPLFGRILDTGEAYPNPKDVSVDLRANDFFANAILGMALAKSRTESLPTALEWLALLDEPRSAESIRRQLPAWRVVACIERGEFGRAREFLKPILEDAGAPIPWLRIAAVGGLRAEAGGQSTTDARGLAREAIAGLASRRELGQVADLARRFGDGALGGSGFAALYVRGALAFERAKAAKDRGSMPAALESYGEAIESLAAALASADVGEYAAASATCRSLLGWSHFERGDYEQARLAFDEAAEASDGRDEEAEWMALVCIEKRLPENEADREAVEHDLRTRMDRFLARHPSSDKVPQLLRRRMALNESPRREDLERLLGMDDRAPGAADGKRQAVAGYYRLFRSTDGAEKSEIGRRFVEAARRLGTDDEHRITGLPGGDVVLSRQVLEVALASGVDDVDIAEAVLDRLEALAAAGEIDASGFAAELAVRRVQVALGRDRLDVAMERLAMLESAGEPMGKATDLARRLVFRWTSAHFEQPPAGIERDQVVAAAWRTGRALLDGARAGGTLEQALDNEIARAVGERTFEAGFAAARRSGDRGVAVEALALGQALLSRRPRDPSLLEAIGELAEDLGDTDLAIDSWKRLVSGSVPDSERWYRAKVALLTLLARIDPAQARAVLDQHKELRPDLGPPPFDQVLRELDRTLPLAPKPASAAPDGVPPAKPGGAP